MQPKSYVWMAQAGATLILVCACLLLTGMTVRGASPAIVTPGPVNRAFQEASRAYGVPIALLQALCYMEGRLSNHDGSPSMDNGFSCMHLIQNAHGDTLDRAARELRVSPQQIKMDMPTSIRAGAILLRDYALQLSKGSALPANLAAWYGAVAAYSNATTRATALLYADGVYALLRQGFSAPADDGEIVTLPPNAVRPASMTAASVQGQGSTALPRGCTNDGQVDYPGALDCIVPSQTFDCNAVKAHAPCTYESAARPTDYQISLVVIHDIEGTAQDSLDVFQNPQSGASAHYVVGSDGTVYQVIRERDIAYHAGNYWYNQHSIGIEHAGIDAQGYRWYNATEYLASARLTAYLLQKYHIPLDHAHVVSHGTVPSPSATSLPNHVDPGPYWLWDYYLKLIHLQGVPFPAQSQVHHIITLHPPSSQKPLGIAGSETARNATFLSLYTGPSTHSGRIPQLGSSADITNVTGNVESNLSVYYLKKQRDQAGSGDTMYEIWYGVEGLHGAGRFAHARLVWLAVPPGGASVGQGTLVSLTSTSGRAPLVYGSPITPTLAMPTPTPDPTPAPVLDPPATPFPTPGSAFSPPGGADPAPSLLNMAAQNSPPGAVGDAPNGALFVSAYTVVEDQTQRLWYEINYNHRQAWVPASEVTFPVSSF